MPFIIQNIIGMSMGMGATVAYDLSTTLENVQ